MLIASATAFETGLSILGYVALLAAGVIVVLSQRTKTTAAQQDMSITALSGRLQAAQDEIAHLRDADTHKDDLLVRQQAQLDALKDAVTSQDLLIVGFTELGVDRSKLLAARTRAPGH